ncbi:amino acid adenylation domain-containing protein/thioester reductase-like protein [Saccharothrix tamanrassetensis]|uniref:Amino acid adenylation domain-containing protein/thioester reductase-like protein n=1 Tax=Saccharothrix tamanrassetensis TaxID=1051531 RepID=A0A841CWV2_9PSEU|nr:amino acid adenylation domain-containing protein [Saccharothrix tamanrassetensis]MBB5960425.1 amino acid adenylation domain-containing protein/thioester reductase-like protein [Saccharothrix tamanrassetensis]
MPFFRSDVQFDSDHEGRVREWNRTSTGYPRTATVPQLFARQVEATPEAEAVRKGATRLTYAELGDRVDRLADHLVALGVRPGEVVGVLLDRSVECVTAILAVMAAGGAYLPLDPEYPDRHLADVLEEANVRTVIADDRDRSTVDDRLTVVDVAVEAERTGAARNVHIGPDDPAYVIFTSGSTGAPKGVVVPHRGPIRLACGGDPRLRLSSDDVLLATTNPTFDVSCFEYFGALLNGARLVLADVATLLDAPALAGTLRAEQVSVMWLSAGLFHRMARVEPALFGSLRCLIAGGDTLSPEAVRQVLAHGRPGSFLDGYGPTENSSLSTVHEVTELGPDAETVPIGTPVANSTAYVVRDDGSLADPGETGELWVGGDGLALGYLGDPAATREKFVPDHLGPDPDGRLYLTGDLARWRPDGVLEFAGRRDRQVKVRGYRIELDEIEVHLSAHRQVREAAVVAPRDGDHDRLLAWVTPHGEVGPDQLSWRLREFLRDRLPEFMVPNPILVRDRMPLTRAGKIDRSRLVHEAPQAGPAPASEPPRTDRERAVARIWSTLLGVGDRIGRDTDFFALGGHSLQATRLAAACRAEFRLPAACSRQLIRGLLANPTVQTFAARIDALVSGEDPHADDGEVDFEAEARLDPEFRCATATDLSPTGLPPTGRTVFLTGGTGFLGTYLLDALVRGDVADRVLCLVRAEDEQAGRRRLGARLRRYGLDPATVSDRVRVVVGDLAAPRLGLDGKTFEAVADDVDTILHSGSRVNFAYPYRALEPSNVGGTRSALDLARTGRPKAFHHISSIAVLAGFGAAGIRQVDEDTPLRFGDRISLGYPETKWVAERLVAQAADQGLAVGIHRPYEITGARDTGVWNTDTMMCALFRSIAETGLAPDAPLPLDFVPVDYTARAIVHILANRPAEGHAYNVTNARDARLALVVDRLRELGYDVETVPYDAWVEHMADLTARDPDQPMAPFMPIFLESARQSDLSVKEMYFAGTFPEFGRANFEAGIADADLTCPPVDADLIDKYLRYFVTSGFLEPPGARR